MTHLPNLLKRVDDYCALLVRAQQSFNMPDDEEPEPQQDGFDSGLYSKIVATANQFSNRDVADEILLIAELYKKSLEIGGGYAQVNKALSTALSNMDALIDEGTAGQDELETAEDILNEVSQDLRQRAKQPSRINEARANQALKETKQAFNQQAIQEEIEQQPNAYEMYQGGDQDNPNQSGHTTPGKAELKTPQNYQQEIARYTDDLNNPAYNQKTKQDINEMIKVVSQLAANLNTVIDLQDRLKDTPNDQQLEQQLNAELDKQQQLQDQRRIIRSKLNSNIQHKKMMELQQQVSATRDPNEKRWLEEKLKLQQLRLSTDLRKGDQIKYQQMLVNSLGTMDGNQFRAQKLSPETEQKIKDAIEAGRTKRITQKDYDRQQTLLRAKQHGKEAPVIRPGRIGGGIKGEKHNDYDLAAATFGGLVDKLSEKINTAVHVARLEITQEVVKDKPKTHNALKEDVNAVSKASKSKDVAAKHQAIQMLRQKLKEKMIEEAWKSKGNAITKLQRSLNVLPQFNKYKQILQDIATWKNGDQWDLTPERQAYIAQIIKDIKTRTDFYKQVYNKDERQGIKPYYDPVLKQLDVVVDRLKQETKAPEPSTEPSTQPQEPDTERQVEANVKPNKRMQLLTKLMTAERLYKMAQQLDPETDAMADQQADQIFDMLFNELINEVANDLLNKKI